MVRYDIENNEITIHDITTEIFDCNSISKRRLTPEINKFYILMADNLKKIINIPNQITNLKLALCKNLEEIPEHVPLTKLHIYSCSKNLVLPKNLTNLKRLSIDHINHLKELPKEYVNLEKLKLIKIKDVPEIPKEYTKLKRLQVYNNNLIPEIYSYPDLEYLNIGEMNNVKSLPENLNKLNELIIYSGGVNIDKIPKTYINLKKLSLSCVNSSILFPLEYRNLEELSLSCCDSFTELPVLNNVKKLDLFNMINIKTIPECYKNVLELKLNNVNIENIPSLLNLKKLEVSNCNKLISISDNMPNLTDFYCFNNRNLVNLPSITSLISLDIMDCPSIIKIPESYNKLEKLKLYYLDNLEEIPEKYIKNT